MPAVELLIDLPTDLEIEDIDTTEKAQEKNTETENAVNDAISNFNNLKREKDNLSILFNNNNTVMRVFKNSYPVTAIKGMAWFIQS